MDAVEAYEAFTDGELIEGSYKSLRLLTKLLGISRGYAWDTIIRQVEGVVENITD